MDKAGTSSNNILRLKTAARPAWWDLYEVVGKIGEGTYGLVYLVRVKDTTQGNKLAIKKFKPSKDGDGVSPTAIREIMLLRECCHENIVKLVNVHINHADASLYLAFDYAEYDLYEIIRFHREKLQHAISPYTVKSLLWQILNGLHYLHSFKPVGSIALPKHICPGHVEVLESVNKPDCFKSNWIIHRDLKPSNILVMREGDEAGVVKLGDFGLARIYQAPLKPLSDNGVVVTVWYRSPDLLLGAKHYTPAVDIWAVGCIFAELLTLKPLFQGIEDKSAPNPFQFDQLEKIFKVLGHPSVDTWPGLAHLPHWQHNRQSIQEKKYDQPLLPIMMQHFAKMAAYDLLMKMFEFDPAKRLTAEQAMKHEYFRQEPLPGKNSFVSGYPNEKVVVYPTRPVDTSLDMGSSEPTPVPNPANPASAHQRRLQQQGGSQPGSGQAAQTSGSRLAPGGTTRRSQGQGPANKLQRR